MEEEQRKATRALLEEVRDGKKSVDEAMAQMEEWAAEGEQMEQHAHEHGDEHQHDH